MLMSSAMQAGLNGHGMDALSEKYLGHQPIPIKSLLGSGKSQITFDRVGIDDAVKYAAEDADVTLRLWELFKPGLHKARVTTVYETLERPLVTVLADMEMAGVQVDRDTLSRMSNAFAQKMAGLDGQRAQAILASDEFAAEVRAQEQFYLQQGIQSVPAVVINGRHLISGGQPPEVFEQALRQIADQTT